ncbi:MAG TPA: PilZ domain-containing protein [Ramlibacter sp.]|nr:PilZ domain-containing protein [Ramlibacter sp.]
MQSAQPRVIVPLGRCPEKRAAERFEVSLPLQLQDGQRATTRDISAGGLSFESRTAYPVGSRIDVTIDYVLDGHNFPLQCEAEVVRCVPAGHGFTIGARLVAPFLDTA